MKQNPCAAVLSYSSHRRHSHDCFSGGPVVYNRLTHKHTRGQTHKHIFMAVRLINMYGHHHHNIYLYGWMMTMMMMENGEPRVCLCEKQ